MAGTTGELVVGGTVGPLIAGCCGGIMLICFDGTGTLASGIVGTATPGDEHCWTAFVFSIAMMGGFEIGGATFSIGAIFLFELVCSGKVADGNS
jgi:hypothetical protein